MATSWKVSITMGSAAIGIKSVAGTAWAQGQFLPQLSNSLPDTVRIIGDSMLIGTDAYFPGGFGRVSLLTRPTGSGIGGTWTRRAVLRAQGSPFGTNATYTQAAFSGTTVVMGVIAQNGNGNPGTQYPSGAYILETAGICPSDFNCSGTLEVADIFAFLNAWFAGAPAADFDGDSVLAVADIFAFLNAWFGGC